jgi:predicted RNA-binding protein with PIN domain
LQLHLLHGVKTIFTKEKETADSFIERYVYELYDKHTKHITMLSVLVIKFIDITFYETISCFFFLGKNRFNTMIHYNAVISDEIICVFDAYDQSGVEREYMYHGVKTIFTKEKEISSEITAL